MKDEEIILKEEEVKVDILEDGEVLIEEVEIEVYAKRGELPPRAKRYIIRVDKEKFTVHTHTITGAEILALVKKTADKFKLYQQRHGHQPVRIEPEQVVDLRMHHVERFTTMQKDPTEGSTDAALDLRRQFKLPSADQEYLDGLGLPWETLKDGQALWLLIHDWTVPTGYTAERVTLALLIPPNYSDEQIDMFYFKPALARTDGKTINSWTTQSMLGGSWQCWSRHRTQANPWRPGIDDVATHLTLVDECLRREFGR
jgi:hypothetical protein